MKKFILPIIRWYGSYYRANKVDIELSSLKHIYIFLAADYGNLGDIAITYAQHKILENYFTDYEIIEVPVSSSLAKIKGVCKNIKEYDILTFVGGGNMGDMYESLEAIRQLVTVLCPKNKIISFPQSVNFSNTINGWIYRISAMVAYRSKNITLLARDEHSYAFMCSNFKARCYIAPDIVLTLKQWIPAHRRNEKVLLCFRNDIERFVSDEFISLLKAILKEKDIAVETIDTHIGDNNICNDNKNLKLFEFLYTISSSKMLITDRLHGMIFAYITGTPAIVLPNSTGKIYDCFKWINNCNFIYYIDKVDERILQKVINKAMNIIPNKLILEKNHKNFLKIFNHIFNRI